MKWLWTVPIGFVLLGQNQPPASLAGHLTNLVTGGPARKAKVTVTRVSGERISATAVSDVNGRFMLNGLPAGSYKLSVQRDGLLPMAYGAKGPNRPGKVLVLGAGEKRENVDLMLQPPVAISGRVLDEDGEPVAGVPVQALHRAAVQGAEQYLPVSGTLTNDIGEYRLFSLPPGKFYVASMQAGAGTAGVGNGRVYSPAFYPGVPDLASAAALNMAAGGEARDIDIHVVKVSSVALNGVVTNPPPAATHAVQVALIRKSQVQAGLSRPMSGYNANTGQFGFRDLTPGSYTLLAWIEDGETLLYANQDVEMAGSEINDARLTLRKGIDLTGMLQLDGAAPPDLKPVRVALTAAEAWGPAPSVMVDAGNRFLLRMPADDTWTIAVTPVPSGCYLESIQLGEEDGLTHPLTVRASSKGPLRITIGTQGGTISGTVQTGGDMPQAVESAAVLLVPDRKFWSVPSYFKTAISDEQGHFELKGIAPGRYRLLALDDMEPLAYLDLGFLQKLDGRGKQVNVARGEKAAEMLTVELLP